MAVLASILEELERSGVPYCVVGATGSLVGASSHDVDLVVEDGRLPDFFASLRRCGAEHAFRIVQSIHHEQTAYFLVLEWGKGSQRDFLQLDVCGDYFRYGKRLIPSARLLAGRTRTSGPSLGSARALAAAPAGEFGYYLTKKVEKRALDAAHGEYLTRLWRTDPLGCRQEADRLWPPALSKEIGDAAFSGDWSPVRSALPRFRRALRRHAGFSAKHWFRELGRRARRLRNPTGLWVAFLGPDGSGKSTVIQRLRDGAPPAFWGSGYFHLRPNVGGAGVGGPPVVDPHAHSPRSAPGSVLKLLYYWGDYVFGYAVRVWPLLVRSRLVLFDRFYHDLLVDPRRYRYGGPTWLVRIVARCLPSPHLVLIFDAPAEVLQSRKKEVPFEETRRQRSAYLRLAAERTNFRVIDATRPIEEVVASVEGVLLDSLAARTGARLGGMGDRP